MIPGFELSRPFLGIRSFDSKQPERLDSEDQFIVLKLLPFHKKLEIIALTANKPSLFKILQAVIVSDLVSELEIYERQKKFQNLE